ncbi:MAG: hypothetical protein MK193_00895 [Lentisphaeria bacterium]|nr:hypothetical protein [Lentisphaeria bacterium]
MKMIIGLIVLAAIVAAPIIPIQNAVIGIGANETWASIAQILSDFDGYRFYWATWVAGIIILFVLSAVIRSFITEKS